MGRGGRGGRSFIHIVLVSQFTVWDVGGQPKLRPLWRHYYFNTQAVIFVVDATDADRLTEAQTELNKLMTERELKDASLLIFANKEVNGYVF